MCIYTSPRLTDSLTNEIYHDTLCWTSVKPVEHKSFFIPALRQTSTVVCVSLRFSLVVFSLLFLRGKCLKHTDSRGQELKPHYGLAPPFSPGVSARTRVWRSSLRHERKCAVATLTHSQNKRRRAGRQTHHWKWLKRLDFISQFPIKKEQYKTESTAARTWWHNDLQCIFLCDKILFLLYSSTNWEK